MPPAREAPGALNRGAAGAHDGLFGRCTYTRRPLVDHDTSRPGCVCTNRLHSANSDSSSSSSSSALCNALPPRERFAQYQQSLVLQADSSHLSQVLHGHRPPQVVVDVARQTCDTHETLPSPRSRTTTQQRRGLRQRRRRRPEPRPAPDAPRLSAAASSAGAAAAASAATAAAESQPHGLGSAVRSNSRPSVRCCCCCTWRSRSRRSRCIPTNVRHEQQGYTQVNPPLPPHPWSLCPSRCCGRVRSDQLHGS